MGQKTKGRIREFLKRFGTGRGEVAIARVSDLLKAGIDRNWLAEEFVRIDWEVWGGITDDEHRWTKEEILGHFDICPHILYCAFLDGKVVSTLLNLMVYKEDLVGKKSWLERTGNGTFQNHRQDGEYGFGASLSVSEDKVQQKIGTKMVVYAILISVVGQGLRSVHLGARIPGYKDNSDIPVEDYVFGKRSDGRTLDGEIYFFERSGFETVEVIPDYMKDPDSLDYGVLMKWGNPLYKLTKRLPFVRWLIQLLGVRFLLRIPKTAPRT